MDLMMIIVFWDIKMISKGYNEIRYMIEYRYGILSQLISEIDNYYQKTFAQFQKEALDLAKQNSSGDFEIYYIRFTPDNGFWKSSLRKESGCSVLAMRDQLT